MDSLDISYGDSLVLEQLKLWLEDQREEFMLFDILSSDDITQMFEKHSSDQISVIDILWPKIISNSEEFFYIPSEKSLVTFRKELKLMFPLVKLSLPLRMHPKLDNNKWKWNFSTIFVNNYFSSRLKDCTINLTSAFNGTTTYTIHLFRNVENCAWMPTVSNEAQLINVRNVLVKAAESNKWTLVYAAGPPNFNHLKVFTDNMCSKNDSSHVSKIWVISHCLSV